MGETDFEKLKLRIDNLAAELRIKQKEKRSLLKELRKNEGIATLKDARQAAKKFEVRIVALNEKKKKLIAIATKKLETFQDVV